ncbi:MAG: hypothetical protein ABSH41_19680 [Syntrophobacteraceae bacterium]
MSLEPDDDIDAEPVIAPPMPSRKLDMETVGRGVLFLMTCIGLVAFGIPLLLLSILTSHQMLQNMVILGIPYQKLVFAFLLSAAITAYICMFFLKMRPPTILVFFALSVFSCLPLMIGLRNNFTLQQAIVDIPFFHSWPFFLRPGYILIEFLIPAAIFVCLGLQIQTMIRRKPYRFTFLFVGLYLCIAVFFGFSALTRAGQPNLADTLSWIKDGREKRAEMLHPLAESAAGAQARRVNQSPVEPVKTEMVSDGGAGVEMDRKVQVLSDKVDRILEVLTLAEARQSAQQTAPHQAEGEAGKEQNPNGRPAQKVAAAPETAEAELSAVNDPDTDLRVVSGKVDRILETLNRVQAVLPVAQENMPASKKVSETGPVSGTRSGNPTGVQSGQQSAAEPASEKQTLEELKQKVQVLSEKMDRVVATLGKMEGLLPPKGKNSSRKAR